MPNWSRPSLAETGPGDTDPVLVHLKRDYRLPVPVDIRRAVDWLSKGAEKQDVLFELGAPGRVRVIEAAPALPRLEAAIAARPDEGADLGLVYSRGSFIRDRLDLSDPVVPHLGILHEIGREETIGVFVRALGGDIEIWSHRFWAEEVAQAQDRQQRLMEFLRRGER